MDVFPYSCVAGWWHFPQLPFSFQTGDDDNDVDVDVDDDKNDDYDDNLWD